MAVYIDKNKLKRKKKYLFQTKGMPFPKSEYFIKMDDVFDMPPADVVEREKIDKAIEEMEQLINHSKLPTVNIYNKYSDGLKDCLEILKRNIGE